MAVEVCDVCTNLSEKEISVHGSVAFPATCYEDDMRVTSVPLHWHDEFEYIIAVEGVVTLNLNARQVTLGEGEAVFINSGCLHSVRTGPGEGVLRSLLVLPKLIGGSRDCSIWEKLITPFSSEAAPSYVLLKDPSDWQQSLAEAMLQAWDVIAGEAYDYENEARFLISRALRILVDHLPQADGTAAPNAPLIKRTKKLLSYIEAHYMEDISNQDLMALCDCCEHVLLKSFHDVMGTSPARYLLRYRLEKSAQLLSSTKEKSCAIASACGFRDSSYFAKMFKRTYGMTPQEYRRSHSAK